MIEGSVNDKLEYAILEIIAAYPEGDHQNHWTSWQLAVEAKMQDCVFTRDDLQWAFQNLAASGALELTKPDSQRRHAVRYSAAANGGIGPSDAKAFFFTGPFNAKITPAGAKYWSHLQKAKMKPISGFAKPR
jgi:hypothetical protein